MISGVPADSCGGPKSVHSWGMAKLPRSAWRRLKRSNARDASDLEDDEALTTQRVEWMRDLSRTQRLFADQCSSTGPCRPSGIAWCRPPPSSCWSRSSRLTSRTLRMAIVPQRGAVDAVKEVHRHLCPGLHRRGRRRLIEVLRQHSAPGPHAVRGPAHRRSARLGPHQDVAQGADRGAGRRREPAHVGGKGNTRGTPQGGVASPLLANIYMNRFLKHWRLSGCSEAFRAHVVAYADDFVILSRGRAAEALAWTKAVMTKLGLTLNEAKTSLKRCPTGALRLPWLLVRSALRYQEERPMVSGRKPVQEERATAQGEGAATCWCPATTNHGRRCATR